MRALIIGDSHVDWRPSGVAIEQCLAAQGYDVTRRGIGLSTTKSWMENNICRPKNDDAGAKCVAWDEILGNGPFDLCLIYLGTNDGAFAQDAAKAKSNPVDQTQSAREIADRVKALATRAGAGRTIWVGPPTTRTTSHYQNAAMTYIYNESARAGVPVFDSRPSTYDEVTNKKSGDGVHVGQKAGEQWASAVCAEVAKGPSKSGTLWIYAGVAVAAVGLMWFMTRKSALHNPRQNNISGRKEHKEKTWI